MVVFIQVTFEKVYLLKMELKCCRSAKIQFQNPSLLGKTLLNFVSPNLKLYNRYCHNVDIKNSIRHLSKYLSIFSHENCIRHNIISNMKLSDFDQILKSYLLIIKLILFQYDIFLFGHGYHAPLEFSDFDQRFLELQISSSGQ